MQSGETGCIARVLAQTRTDAIGISGIRADFAAHRSKQEEKSIDGHSAATWRTYGGSGEK
jgi:hypothetical protein